MNHRLPLGAKARDVVTGFSGTITGVARYLTGCDQYLLVAPVGTDGTTHHGWYDDNRVEQVGADIVKLAITPEDTATRGGPASIPAPVR